MTTEDRLQDQRPKIVWVNSRLDDLGLSLEAFRVYCHLARRVNDANEAWPSYKSIGEKCFRGSLPKSSSDTLRRKAISAVHELLEWNLIAVEHRKAKDDSPTSNLYSLTDISEWQKKRPDFSQQLGGSDGEPLPSVGGTPGGSDGEPLPSVGGTPKGIPYEGIPNIEGIPLSNAEEGKKEQLLSNPNTPEPESSQILPASLREGPKTQVEPENFHDDQCSGASLGGDEAIKASIYDEPKKLDAGASVDGGILPPSNSHLRVPCSFVPGDSDTQRITNTDIDSDRDVLPGYGSRSIVNRLDSGLSQKGSLTTKDSSTHTQQNLLSSVNAAANFETSFKSRERRAKGELPLPVYRTGWERRAISSEFLDWLLLEHLPSTPHYKKRKMALDLEDAINWVATREQAGNKEEVIGRFEQMERNRDTPGLTSQVQNQQKTYMAIHEALVKKPGDIW